MQVKEAMMIAVKVNESMKIKKVGRTMKVLELAKKHGGPNLAEIVQVLQTLTEERIIL